MVKKDVEQFISDLGKFDKTYGCYSSRFDLPFMRTRALYHGLKFPAYGDGYHKDLYYTAKGRLATSSKKLMVVADDIG